MFTDWDVIYIYPDRIIADFSRIYSNVATIPVLPQFSGKVIFITLADICQLLRQPCVLLPLQG